MAFPAGVIIVDTTNDISSFIQSVGIPATDIITLLLVLIVALSVASATPIVSQFVYLCTSIVVGLLLTENTALFPETSSVRSMFLYVMFTTTILMVIEWIPQELSRKQLTQRIKFVLGYAAGERVVTVFSVHNKVAFAILFLTATFFIHKKTWFGMQPKSESPLFIRCFYPIMRQALISLSIKLVIAREKSRATFQDLLYCLGLMTVVAFLVTIIHEESWRPYALWRVADWIVQDLASIPGNSLWSLSCFTIATVLLISAVSPNYTGQYLDLAKVVTGSTFTRAVLQAAQSLPPIDLIILRILVVVLFF
jgi:hypothetical protein